MLSQACLTAGAPYAPLKSSLGSRSGYQAHPSDGKQRSGLKVSYGMSQCDLSFPPSKALPGPPHTPGFSASHFPTTPVGFSVARKSRVGVAHPLSWRVRYQLAREEEPCDPPSKPPSPAFTREFGQFRLEQYVLLSLLYPTATAGYAF